MRYFCIYLYIADIFSDISTNLLCAVTSYSLLFSSTFLMILIEEHVGYVWSGFPFTFVLIGWPVQGKMKVGKISSDREFDDFPLL